MHLRALIVLLLALNIGVALWWTLLPSPVPEPVPARPADVPRLLLVAEAEPGRLQAAALSATNATAQAGETPAEEADATAALPEDVRCYSIGPWDDVAGADAARDVLRPQAVRLRTREAPTGTRGWRVITPALADRAAAQETVDRLLEAGFDDHFIISQGEQANAVALGRFSAEETARRHETALQEAGFEAVAEPLGATGTQAWIDLAAGEDFDPGQAREATGAGQADPIDCARLQ